MWRWCAYLVGVMLIGVAIAAVPSSAIFDSYAGGSAVDGGVENGRYFVDPGHNGLIVEVSESTWWTAYWLERLWPFSALVPCFAGLFLLMYGLGPNWKPPAAPPKEMPPWAIRACAASGVFTVIGAWLFWVIVRIPWATMAFGWILFCVSVGWVAWSYSRSLRQQSDGESGAAPGPGAK